MKTKRNIPFILLLFLTNGWLVAQVAQVEPKYVENTKALEYARSEQAIETLANTALVVRIPSYSKKIEELQIRVDERSGNTLRYTKMLKDTREKRTEFAYMIMSAFKEGYSFSDVYFIWDTTRIVSGTGIVEGVFLDEYLNINDTLSFNTDPGFLITYMGETSPDTGAGIHAMVVCDESSKPLKAPFPYYAPFNYGGDTLRMLFFRNVTKADLLRRSIQNWDKALNRYLERVNPSSH